MLVFWKERLVLLAVPKTGTTALEAALAPRADVAMTNPPRLKHMTVRRYKAVMAPLLDPGGDRPLELVAVMREPVSWLSSWHRYRGRAAISGRPQSTEGIDFAAFVAAWLEDDPPEFARVGRQSRFLDADAGPPGVDRLFRHDRMEAAVAYLTDRLGMAIDLPRLNASPPGSDTDLPAALRARLETEAAAEFALWRSLEGC